MFSRVGPWFLGLVGVLGLRLATAEPQDPVATPPPAPRLQPASEPAPRDTGHLVDPAACAELQSQVHARLDGIQREVQEIEDLRVLLSGEPIPWPDAAPEHVREDAVREAFEAAAELAEGAMALRSLRCDEYPCVGIFEQTDGGRGALGVSSSASTALLRAFEELGVGGEEHGAVLVPLGSWRPSSEGNHHVAIALAGSVPDEAVRRRIGQRWMDAMAESD